MGKKKNLVEWYIENTPSDEEGYEKGCLSAFCIIAFFFLVITGLFIILT